MVLRIKKLIILGTSISLKKMVFKHATCDGGICIVRNTQMALQEVLGIAFCTSAQLPFPDK